MKRQSLLPRLLSVSQGAAVCRKPFKPPSSKTHASTYNQDLTRRLSARKRFVPWGSSSPIPRPAIPDFQFNVSVSDVNVPVSEEPKPSLPPGIDPLVLWHPQDSHDDPSNTNFTTITVDPLLVRYLRPHQRSPSLHPISHTLTQFSINQINFSFISLDAEKGFSSCLIVSLVCVPHQIYMDAFWQMIWGNFFI